ncbi:MAG: glycosylase [Isosphaeraceae bacterium]
MRIRWVSLVIGLALNVAGAVAARAGDFPQELVSWEPAAPGAVFQGEGGAAWDRKIRERGFIRVVGKEWKLWYTGYNEERSPLKSLGLATSTDGLVWTRNPSNPIHAASWTEDVWVGEVNGGYVMFAEGANDVAHLMTSRDGIAWTDHGPLDVRRKDGTPISAGPYGTPTGWYENGQWYLFYERGDLGVWLAKLDGANRWVNVQDTPVLELGPGPYDRGAVAMNQVIRRDGVYYAFYHAAAERPWKEWTSCIARSHDLIHWEKYAGNPIVRENCSSPILVERPEGDRLYTMHPSVRVFRPRRPTGSEAGGRP